MVTIFLLVGCLGYSNSAVNPILYAFLSDNFKKSFMKACVCAAQRDVNRALIAENSVATRRVKNNSERARLTAANAAAGTAESNQLTVNNSQMLNVPCSAASCSPLSHHEEQQQHHQPAV